MVVTAARVVIGVSSGASTVLVPIYLGELGECKLVASFETTAESYALSIGSTLQPLPIFVALLAQ